MLDGKLYNLVLIVEIYNKDVHKMINIYQIVDIVLLIYIYGMENLIDNNIIILI